MFKRIFIPIIIIAAIIGGYFIFQKFSVNKTSTVATTQPITDEVSYEDFEKDGPIFTDIPIDKVWEFTFDKELDVNFITNETIKVVDSETQSEIGIKPALEGGGKKIVINPPDGNYKKGTTYQLSMSKDIKYVDGSTVRNPYKAEFITARDEVEKGTLNKNLILIDKEDIKSIEGNIIKISKITKKELKKGDIIVVPTEEHPEGQAFKIEEVNKNISSLSLTVVQPEFAELFEELDIYKTYEITADNIELEKGITGVNIEQFSLIPVNTLIASTNSTETGDNEFQLPKVTMDITKGFKFSFDKFQLGKGTNKAFLNGSLAFSKPKISTDVDLGFMKIKKFNVILKTAQDHKFKITLPAAEKAGEKVVYKDETKKKLKKMTERIKLAKVNVPTSVPGVFLQGTLYIKVDYNFSYEPEASITFEFEDERGVIYKNGKKPKPVKNTTSDIDLTIKGNGKLESRIGAAANMGVTAYGVLGAGVEAFGGGKATGEFFNGNNDDFGNYFCLKGSYNAVVEGSLYVDVVKERMVELKFAEFNIPPKYELGNCEIFDSLKIDKKEINMKPGETLEISIKGKYKDLSTQKSKTENLRNFDDLKVTSSDKSVVEVIKEKNKLIIKTPSYPTNETATITVEYKEKGEVFGKDITSKIELPVKLTDIPKQLPEAEVKKIITELYANVQKTFSDLGKKHNWSINSNPMNFNIMEPELLKYATSKFTNGELKTLAEEYYCDCDAVGFPRVDFDIRMKIVENTNKKIVVSGIEFMNEMGSGSGTFYLTAIRQEDKWVLDDWKYVTPEEEDMKVTWKEYQAYEKKYTESGTLVNEVTHNGRKVYVITYGDLYHRGVYAYSTDFIYDIPNEWLPEELRIPTSSSLDGRWKTRQGSKGTLTISNATEENFNFQINVVSSGGHVGDLSGKAIKTDNFAKFMDSESDCVINFSINGDVIQLGESQCSYWHGAGVEFTGDYYKE